MDWLFFGLCAMTNIRLNRLFVPTSKFFKILLFVLFTVFNFVIFSVEVSAEKDISLEMKVLVYPSRIPVPKF